MNIQTFLLARIPSLLEGVWIMLFLRTQFPIKIKQKWIVWLGTPLAWSAFSYVVATIQNCSLVGKTASILGLTFLWTCLFYDGTLSHKAFASIVSIPIMQIFDVLGGVIFQFILQKSLTSLANNLPIAIVVKAFAIATILLLEVLIRNQDENQLQAREWGLLIFFVGLILFVMVNMVKTDMQQGTFSQDDIPNELAMMALLCLVFYIVRSLSERHMLKQERAVLKQQVEEEQRSVQALTETHQAIRHLSHDFRDHLVCIQGYLEHDRPAEALQYVNSISMKIDHAVLPVHTNNIAVDAVLNEKYLTGMQHNISFQFAVKDLSDMPISDVDAVTILANALNNALEACEQISGKRWIYIQIGTRGNTFLISIKNPTSEAVEIIENQVKTTKKDKSKHGIGLPNVQMTVNKNEGQLFLSCENNIFLFLVVLNLNSDV